MPDTTPRLSFKYPASLKFIGWLGVVVFGGLTIMSLVAFAIEPPEADAWFAPPVFVLFTAVSAYLAVALSGRVIIDGEGVTLARFGGHRQVRFADIAEIEQRLITHRLVIHTHRGDKFIVEKQLERYADFYALLRERLPESVQPDRPDLPLYCKARMIALITAIVFSCVAAGMIVGGGIKGSWGLAAFGVVILILMIVALIRIPTGYRFDVDHVAVCRRIGDLRFDVDQLAALNLVRRPMPKAHQDVYVISMQFDGGRKLEIGEQDVAYPIETLFDALVNHYRPHIIGLKDDTPREPRALEPRLLAPVLDTPNDVYLFNEQLIERLRAAHLNVEPLETVHMNAYTTPTEWLGDLRAAIESIRAQSVPDPRLELDLAHLERFIAAARPRW